jgi:regulator of nonsense transcripts 1
MTPYTLQTNPSKDDDTWRYSVPQEVLLPRPKSKGTCGKFIKFTAQAITFEMTELPHNRVLHGDDPAKFILLSFGDLRFPEANLRATSDYIARLMKAGLFLNNIQYRFYHHSNSQLVCLLLTSSFWKY